MADGEHATTKALRLKQLQRSIEYILLIMLHTFFLIAFRRSYSIAMAIGLGIAVFGMNFQLTQLREQRRTDSPESRSRILADTFESILFLFFVTLMSFGSGIAQKYDINNQEYIGYVATILGSIFLAGLIGEVYWQRRNLRRIDNEHLSNYITNLRRTIILPYMIARRRRS